MFNYSFYSFNDTFKSGNEYSALREFESSFSIFHGYASIVVCIFGVCTNIFNITILTRRDMRTPTNIILSWLAVADILTMLPYIPFAIHFYCPNSPPFIAPEKYSYKWILYMLFVINSAATTHTISNWLGVSLSFFRFLQMRSTSRGPLAKERRITQVKIVTVIIYLTSCMILVPNYLTNEIESHPGPRNTTIYRVKSNETDGLVVINFVIYAVVAKVVPCLLMIVFSGSLVYTVSYKNRHRRKRLAAAGKKSKRDTRQTTTTRMLLVVIVLFLLTELPQGIMILVSASIPHFYDNVYSLLGDFMDFIALLNTAINFVLYCIMSQQFRYRFIQMYLRRKRPHQVLEDTGNTSERLYLKKPLGKISVTY
ncbi:hypothetical protein SNE40_014787 [Patella caerulea]|uniref:G-protein coupled receptors family 1 profile domain-containing protein n=1 Tax=Patella caerulea TaxID=87958 RepID=A0AAN8PHZ5_PATCE